MENSEQEPQIGDICWAKVKGHPWWPAKVSSNLFEYLFQFN